MRYHPWRHLRSIPDLRLSWADLPGLLGIVRGRDITLATGQLQAERRCTLAHELVHVERGTAEEPWCEREERHVDAIAARRLVPLDDLIEAVLWARNVHELAEELWVDVATVQARLASLTAAERERVQARLEQAGVR